MPRRPVLLLVVGVAALYILGYHRNKGSYDENGWQAAITDQVQLRTSDSLPSAANLLILHSTEGALASSSVLCIAAREGARLGSGPMKPGSPAGARPLVIVVDEEGDFETAAALSLILNAVAEDPACGDGSSTPFITVKVASSGLPNLLQSTMPLLILEEILEGSRLRWKTERPGVVWITMPSKDVASAGWILTLPPTALEHWDTPIFKLLVITNDRPVSLQRLLNSLTTAHYYGDSLDVKFSVDATATESTMDIVKDYVNHKAQIIWPQGRSSINHRFRHAGLITNIVEAWYPSHNNEYALFFEDDIEASPYYYAWTKYVILMYRYGPESHTLRAKSIYAVSLYHPKASELHPVTGCWSWNVTKILQKEAPTQYHPSIPFLFQVPCSWGAAYFPEHWREFHHYIRDREAEGNFPLEFKVVSPKVVSNKWTVSWKRYIIELVFLRGYTTVFPNYSNYTSLSTTHVEFGAHVPDEKIRKTVMARQFVPLMQSDRILELPGGSLPPLSSLPVFDLWGFLSSDKNITRAGWERRKAILPCKSDTRENGGPSDYNAETLMSCPGETFEQKTWNRNMAQLLLKEQALQEEL